MAYGSASVATTSVLVVPENWRRKKLAISNNNSANDIWICPGGATTSQGIKLPPNTTFTDERDPQGYIYRGVWCAISDVAGPSTLTWYEDEG